MFWRKKDDNIVVGDMMSVLITLKRKVEELEGDIDRLRDQHNSLRGAYYQSRNAGHERRVKSRAELLAERFTPGLPARHQESAD